MQVSRGMVPMPPKVVVYGAEGIGKTTLAAQFPNPLFIDTEGGTRHLDVARADPAPTSWQMLMGYIKDVADDPSVCSTLVIDTADWAERLCTEAVLAKHGVSGVEDFGYGKGYTYVREEFARMLDALGALTEKGVCVVVCAHAQIKKFEKPDELGTYDRWELKLSRQCAPVVKEWADMVLFCDYETVIVKPDQKTGGHAKAQGGRRTVHTTHSPAWDAKNRCGMPEKLPLEWSAIEPYVLASWNPAGTTQQPVAQQAAASAGQVPQPPQSPADTQNAPQEAGETPQGASSASIAKLRDLMAASGVSEASLRAYCARRGYCTEATQVDVYPEDFAAFLASTWDEVAEDIAVQETPVPFEAV